MRGRLPAAAGILLVASTLWAPRALMAQVGAFGPVLLADPTGHAAPVVDSARSVATTPVGARQVAADAPWKPALLSAGLPGVGQRRLGQRRGWVYAALEVAGWILYVDRRATGGDFRTRYRDFAWTEARIQSASRVDGDFGYYETLTKWSRSGTFDGDANASGVQPETDETTFNGSIWALASGLFLPPGSPAQPTDSRYLRALDFYVDRAYGTELLWDWGGTGNAQDEYADLIRRSDEGFRQATNVLGAIIANHVVSSVDAYASARGLATPDATRVGASPGPSGTRWSVSMSWATAR